MYIIIGASSFIGENLYYTCVKQKKEVIGTYYLNKKCEDWIKFNLIEDNFCSLYKKYIGKKIEAVIICSAETSIDKCKTKEELSYKLNVLYTKKLLDDINKCGIKSVFMSSEAVFDGKKGLYAESDIANPITQYGKQKLEVEKYIREMRYDTLIFRISRAVGCRFDVKDIFYEFYKRVIQNEEIICLENQMFCITEVNDICNFIIKALEKKLTGLYHISSANYVSRYELAQIYCRRIFGGYGKIFEKKYCEIPFADNRHIYGGLNGEKINNLLRLGYLSTEEILDAYYLSYCSEKGRK